MVGQSLLNIKPGTILVAPPALTGNFWHQTVILITEHRPDRSIGVVLNKPSQLSLSEFGEQMHYRIGTPGSVYIGGPANIKSLGMIHTSEWKSKNTMKLTEDISISSDNSIIPRLSMGATPLNFRFFLGLCVWQPGQLLAEIKGTHHFPKETSWCTTSANLSLVFDLDTKEQWCAAIDRSGLEFAQHFIK